MKTSALHPHRERALGADELFLILLLVFLATLAGSVKGRTYLKDGLHITSEKLAGGPKSQVGALHIVFDGDVRVEFEEGPWLTITDPACGDDLKQSIAKNIVDAIGTAGKSVSTTISPRADTPICVYLDTQHALRDLSQQNVVADNVRIEEQQLLPEKRP